MVYERLCLCVFALSTLLHDGITSNLYNTHITQVWRSKVKVVHTCEQPLQCGGHCVETYYVYRQGTYVWLCICTVLCNTWRCAAASISFKFGTPLDGLLYTSESWSCLVDIIIIVHFVGANKSNWYPPLPQIAETLLYGDATHQNIHLKCVEMRCCVYTKGETLMAQSAIIQRL